MVVGEMFGRIYKVINFAWANSVAFGYVIIGNGRIQNKLDFNSDNNK